MANAIYKPHSGDVKLTMLLGGVVILLLMVFGLLMRMAQAGFLNLDPTLFYQLMTAHGAGMVGSAALTGAAIMWYFVGRYVPLLVGVYRVFLALFLLGVVLILGGIFIGGYAGAWTFLFPLPAMSGGVWPSGAAISFLLGYTSIGVGFLLYYLEIGRHLISNYGGISGALAWGVAFGSTKPENAPPATIVAAMATTIFNTMGIVIGAAVLISSLVNLLFPAFAVNALLAKNMIFFFGHVFINASIYMAVIAVYEIIGEYTGKTWKTTKPFAIAWSFILLMVMAVYPHHLLQDVNMPSWALVMGQILSYLSGIPLLAVTALGLASYIRGSGMKWDLPSSLLVLAVAGWSIGSVPAIIDGMIAVNRVMHNTQWVPGHFHIYLLLGEVAMAFGFMAWLARTEAKESMTGMAKLGFMAYVVGGFGFTISFLVAGASSVPRRWAVHLPQWMAVDQLASLFALLIIIGAISFVIIYLKGIGNKTS